MQTAKILILEDDPERIHCFMDLLEDVFPECSIIASSNAEFVINKLTKDSFDFLLLDHDLDGRVYVPTHELNTGSQVCRFLNQNPFIATNTKISIHSLNDRAVPSMLKLLEHRNARWIPGLWEKEIFQKHISFFR